MRKTLSILLIAATELEIQYLSDWWQEEKHHYSSISIQFLVTGIGMSQTTFQLTCHLMKHSYDLLIQAGLAGAYNRDLNIGDVVAVLTEVHGDIGYEEIDGGIYALEAFSPEKDRIRTNFHLNDWFQFNLPKVIGLSVDTTTGLLSTVERRTWQYNADIETMEGFATHLVADELKIPYLQIRAISNYVEQRNKEQWNIPLALKNLNDFLVGQFFPQILKA